MVSDKRDRKNSTNLKQVEITNHHINKTTPNSPTKS